jgi:hypothetical protein
MAASDARPVPRKNAAWRYYFDVRKNDGTLITTWTGQDTEVSIDGGNFADATAEATEIQTSGCGYIDLSADEMNGDCIVIKTTVTNAGALPVVTTVFPEEAGDYRLADTQKVDLNTIKTQTVTCGAGVTVLASVGTAATSTAQTGDSYAIVNGDHGLVSIQDDLDTVLTRLVGTILAGNHTAQTGDSYAIVNGDHGLVSVQDDIDTLLTRIVGTLLAGNHTAQSGDSYALANGDHGFVSIQDDLDEVLTRLPDATAGANGGLLIAGSNAATTFATLTTTGAWTNGSTVFGNTTMGTLTQTGAVSWGATTWAGWDVSGTVNYASGVTYATTLTVAGVTTFTGAVALTDVTTAGSLGKYLADTLADTGELQTNQGNWLTATGFSTHSAADVVTALGDGSTLTEAGGTGDQLTALPAVTLANGAHGGAAATLVLSDYSDFQGDASSLTEGGIADAVLNEAMSGHTTVGSLGKAVADILEDTGTTLPAAIALVGGSAGAGAESVTITWTDGSGNPVADGDVWITTDAAGSNVVAGTLQTNTSGQATFMLDAGETYYLFAQHSGYNSIRGQSFVAVAD